jgi:anti-sigma B factor antagonist
MPDEDPWRVDVDQSLGVPVLVLEGEHDVSTSRELEVALEDLVAAGGPVIVDATRVTFIDSTTLGTLLTAHQRAAAAGGELVVVLGADATYTVRNALKLVGMTRLARVFASREEAAAALAHRRASGD